MEQTIAAIATPPGTGGIAVVRLSGEKAYAVAEKVFLPVAEHKKIAAQKGYTALFGHFVTDGKVADEVVALCFRAPRSYTGEDVVELSCHGGSAVSEQLLRACFAAGARPASAGEFTKRAFLNGRISLTQAEAVMDIIEQEKVDRFCMYHLVYAGRGSDMKNLDLPTEEKREICQFLIDKTLDFNRRGVDIEILTTDNHADGLYLLDYIKQTNPERVDEVRQLLALHGGCSAGDRMADVDYLGNVHPCQFWSDMTLGNVRERKFSEIWNDLEANDGILARLRSKPEQLNSQCGQCSQNELCGGCRIRAAVDGDIWGDDPACFWQDPAKETK